MPHSHPLYRLNDAIPLLHANQLAEAQALCQSVIDSDDSFVEARLLLGLVNLAQADFVSAKANLEPALRRPPVLFSTNDFYVETYHKAVAVLAIQEKRAHNRAFFDTLADRLVLEYLEMDIAYACNLSCDGCTHYSNYNVKGYVDAATGCGWIDRWGRRVYPRAFKMLGGEPTINPGLSDYIATAHRIWPQARRELVTNGFFLLRHAGLFELLAQTATRVSITIHEDTDDYRAALPLAEIREQAARVGVGLHVSVELSKDFRKYYTGEGPSMRPYADAEPELSHANCFDRRCTTLHLGRLWKCPPIAFLNNIDPMFDLSASPDWQPYLQHKGLGFDASDDEIRAYVQGHGYFCAMCPARS